MFDYKLIEGACSPLADAHPPLPRRLQRRKRQCPVLRPGILADRPTVPAPPPQGVTSPLSDLHIGEFSRNVRRNVGAADAYARRQALLLIPPATALNRREKPQMLSVSEDAHGELPESDYRQEQTQLHDCNNETETMKSIVLRFRDKNRSVAR